MTSFAQFNNFEPHEDKMASQLPISSSVVSAWQHHRVGITFVAVVLALTVTFFAILLLIKWREKIRQRSAGLQPEDQRYLRDRTCTCKSRSTRSDGCGALLKAGDAEVATLAARGHVVDATPASGDRLHVKWMKKMFGVVRGFIVKTKSTSPSSDDSITAVIVVESAGARGTPGGAY